MSTSWTLTTKLYNWHSYTNLRKLTALRKILHINKVKLYKVDKLVEYIVDNNGLTNIIVHTAIVLTLLCLSLQHALMRFNCRDQTQ
jgi:hypothetical protein